MLKLLPALALLLLLGACGDDDDAPVAPKPPPMPPPAELVGRWVADESAVRETVLRFIQDRVDLTALPPGERDDARADMERKADTFMEAWSFELALHADNTFVYKLTQAGSPTYLRAGSFTVDDRLLTLEVEETKNEKGETVKDHWPRKWLTHAVRWEADRLRFEALGRETFEFLLYRE